MFPRTCYRATDTGQGRLSLEVEQGKKEGKGRPVYYRDLNDN